MTELISRFARHFLHGLIFLVPLGIIVYVLANIWQAIRDYSFTDNVWISFLIIIFAITALGYLATSLIARPIFRLFESLLTKAPLINFIYSSIKDLMEAFVGEKKRFDRPVLVNISRDSSLQKLGFITVEDMEILGIPGKVAVYLPHSYNFSGNLFVVSRDQVQAIHANSADVMKFIVSGGISGLKNGESPDKHGTGKG